LHLSFGNHMHTMHALLHSLESIGRISFSFASLQLEQVKLPSSLVYPCTFHFFSLPFISFTFSIAFLFVRLVE